MRQMRGAAGGLRWVVVGDVGGDTRALVQTARMQGGGGVIGLKDVMVAVGIHLRAQRVQEEGEEVVGQAAPNDLRAISRSLAGAVVLEEGESEHRGGVCVGGGMVIAHLVLRQALRQALKLAQTARRLRRQGSSMRLQLARSHNRRDKTLCSVPLRFRLRRSPPRCHWLVARRRLEQWIKRRLLTW